MNDVYITKTASFLPNEPVDNSQIESVLGMINGRPSRTKKVILKSNKIKERYYALSKDGQYTHDCKSMAATAIKLLDDEHVSHKDATCLIASSSTPDQLLPSHALMVQGELKLSGVEAISTSGICMCGVTALKHGYYSVLSNEHQNTIVSATEFASSIIHAKNYESEAESSEHELESSPELAFDKSFLRWMLSDGSGAFMLSNSPKDNGLSLKIEFIDIYSYADHEDVCMYSGAIKESGEYVGWAQLPLNQLANKNAMALKQDVKLLNDKILLYTVEQSLPKTIDKHQIDINQIDYFLPHISSGYFYNKLKKSLENIGLSIPTSKWFTNLYSKGNTGAASIFIMLDELVRSNTIKSGDKILCFVPESGRFSSSFFLLTAVEQ